MIILSKDTKIARSSPTMIAAYLASLLEVGKFRCIACSITSLIGALSYSPRPTPICCKDPSTFIIHQSKLSDYFSC